MKRSVRLLAVLPLVRAVMAALVLTPSVRADVTLPAVFTDHMVLQAGAPAPVWGWGEPGEQVTVEFAGQKKTAKAGADGKWMVKLDPMPASAEPRDLHVSRRPRRRRVALFRAVEHGDVGARCGGW
ncbi:MAG: hypothetical protein FJ272_15795 [Planctomycetes bacterium]|nr:hypothetical protein [Planctomycetota bacterium]